MNMNPYPAVSPVTLAAMLDLGDELDAVRLVQAREGTQSHNHVILARPKNLVCSGLASPDVTGDHSKVDMAVLEGRLPYCMHCCKRWLHDRHALHSQGWMRPKKRSRRLPYRYPP